MVIRDLEEGDVFYRVVGTYGKPRVIYYPLHGFPSAV